MQAISDIKIIIPTTSIDKQTTRRNRLLNDLYELYLEECNKQYYVKNRKRYMAYIKKYHPEALVSKELYNSHKQEFREALLPIHQRYLKAIDKNSYLWWGRFSHLKGEEGNEALRHILSVAKDKEHRKEQVIPYILGCIK